MSNKKPRKPRKPRKHTEDVPLTFDYVVKGESRSLAVWGPFIPFFDGHAVAVKHRSADLRSNEFYLLLDVALRMDVQALLLGEVRMCLLCVERPAELLEELVPFLIPGPVTGSWLVRLGPAGYALIVVAPELPLQPGTAALRFGARWDEECDYLAAVQQMLADPALPAGLAEKLLLEDLLVEVDRDDAAAVASAHRRHARLVTDWCATQTESIGFQ
jgi:hypothetical protein